jgi:flagellar basal body-associated protein FliL
MFTNEFGETNWTMIIFLILLLVAIGAGAYFWFNRDDK